MRVLAIIAGGLGNQMQMTAPLVTLRERLGWRIEVVSVGAPVAGGPLREMLPFPTHGPGVRTIGFDGVVGLGFGSYGGNQADGWRGLTWLNTLSDQVVRTAKSEVDVAMDACRELGVAEEDLIWHGEMSCNEEYQERFDVVIANNYYKGPNKQRTTDHWHVRGYPGIKTLAAEIRKAWPELSICCIGLDDREYVEGTTDRTGLPLGDALALIKRARILISTDTMAFHAGACFDTPTFAIWTATSRVKSACPKFHHTARLIGRDDLACRDTCFADRQRWTHCQRWECQEIGVGHIMGIIEEERGKLWK